MSLLLLWLIIIFQVEETLWPVRSPGHHAALICARFFQDLSTEDRPMMHEHQQQINSNLRRIDCA